MSRARFDKPGPLALAPKAWGGMFDLPNRASAPFREESGVAVVSIKGPLTHEATWFFDDYQAVKARVAAALESSCKAVVLDIDSPGGDVAGCFETAREIRAMAAASKRPLFAFVESLAASGGYALACAATSIAVAPSGFVGSVGVINTLADQSAMDRAIGLNFAVVTSGARKADGNPHVPTSEGAIAECKAQVDSLAELFFAWVSESRGIGPEAVRRLEAATFHGDKAVAVGLADVVMTRNELLAIAASGKASTPARVAEEPMEYKDLVAAMEKMAEGDGEEADKCKRALKALDGKDADGDNDGDKEPPQGEGDEPPPADDKEKKDEAKKASARTRAARPGASSEPFVVELATRLQATEERLEQVTRDAEEQKRAQVLAARPDIKPELAKTLRKMPLALMEETVAGIPAPAQRTPAAAADARVQATRGKGQVGEGEPGARTPQLPPEESRVLRQAMGLEQRARGIRRERNSVVFDVMTPEEAREFTAKRAAKSGEGGSK